MNWYIAITALVAAGLPLAAIAMKRYPRLYCALHGHVPRCSIENCGVIKFTCDTCHQEVNPHG